MRASVEASKLSAALSDIGGVAGRDADIIQCVRISAKDNSLRLITTNIEVEAHAIVEAATPESGHVCVNARDLALSLKGVSGCVELLVSPEGLSISCSAAQVTLPVRYEEFPRLPAPKDMTEIIGGVDAFLTCCPSVSKDEAWWHYTGVGFDGENAIGTDGKTARVCPANGGGGRVVPGAAQAIISKLRGRLFVSDALWRLEQEGRAVIGRLLDADCPNVARLPNSLPLAWSCDAEAMRQAIEAVSFGRASFVVLTDRPSGICVSGEKFTGVPVSATREVSAAGPGAVVVCSVRSLLAALHGVKGAIEVRTNGAAIEFVSNGLRSVSMAIRDHRNAAPPEPEAA